MVAGPFLFLWSYRSLGPFLREVSAPRSEKYSSDLPDQSRPNDQLRYSFRELYG